jgi:3-oxoacyl-[acyl-carrier protein] reductase
MQLAGKIAIVTGGGTGIGKATSLALARAGASVGVNFSRSEADAVDTVKEIELLGGRAIAARANVAVPGDVDRMVRGVVSELGGVDVLVNNAGTTRFIDISDLDAITDQIWDDILGVNLKGAFYCARAVAPHMREHGHGAIVNVSSVSGLTGNGSSLPYAVSKAALIGLTKSLARALAPGVRVNSVAPGIVRTRWVAGREEHVRRLGDQSLLGVNASPEDIAAMILSLLENDAITGQTIVVDGGVELR